MKWLIILIASTVIFASETPSNSPMESMCAFYGRLMGVPHFARWAICERRPIGKDVCQDHVCNAMKEHPHREFWWGLAKELNCDCEEKPK